MSLVTDLIEFTDLFASLFTCIAFRNIRVGRSLLFRCIAKYPGYFLQRNDRSRDLKSVTLACYIYIVVGYCRTFMMRFRTDRLLVVFDLDPQLSVEVSMYLLFAHTWIHLVVLLFYLYTYYLFILWNALAHCFNSFTTCLITFFMLL